MFVLSHRRESHRGEATQDRLLALRVGAGAWVLALADGTGDGGERAAQTAVDAVAEVGRSLVRRDSQAWYRLLRAIDDVLAREETPGQTSLVALCVTPRRIVGASVGDVAARWVGPEGTLDLTEGQNRRPLLGAGAALPVAFALPTPGRGALAIGSGGFWRSAPLARVEAALAAPPSDTDLAGALTDLACGPDSGFLADVAVLALRRSEAPGARLLRALKR